ncbi:MAG: hypothetical protein J6K76_00125 [Spirochaetaceae bacterium]|nr:hypothetical protein [Spirochaetaceae bacterium]
MTDSVIIDLLILGLLLAVNMRLFFVARGQRDAIVLLAPVAFVICIVSLLAWDISLPKGGILLLSFLVLLENSHGLWRFFNQLYIDSFSPLLWLVSIVNILLILAIGFVVVIFRPVLPSQDVEVELKNYLLVGTVHSGLAPRGNFESVDVRILQSKPADTDSPWTERGSSVVNPQRAEPHLPLVLWITDVRSSVSRVEPIATTLASLGYEVVVADFNQNMVLSSQLRLQSLFFADDFEKKLATLQRESSFQYEAILNYFGGEKDLSNRRVLLLADGYTSEGAKAVCLMNEYVAGYYTIDGEDSLGSYNTIPDWADGFGPLGETAPWINYLVMETPLLESRDETRFHSIAVAQQVHRVFSDILVTQQEVPAEVLVEGFVEELVSPNQMTVEGES